MNAKRDCIFCLLPADLRTGRVAELASGRRVHRRCIHPLLIELASVATKPRPRREPAAPKGGADEQ